MNVRRDVAVAICQEYGFRMADGWSDSKLAKKVKEIVDSFRSGDFDVEDEDLAGELSRLTKAGDDDVIEIVISSSEELDDGERVEEERNLGQDFWKGSGKRKRPFRAVS